MSESEARPRGRPRSVEARAAILRATREILNEGGITAVTMEGIAARAGVGKPTIYRAWPNAHAVAMAAMMDTKTKAPKVAHTRSAIADLKQQLRGVADAFASRMGRQVTSMIAAASAESELSKVFRNHFILARREEGRAILLRAIATKEVRRGIDIDVALDMIYGPLFYRLLMGHAALDGKFTDAVVEHALKGLRT
ncbi:MAG: TetR/AcrR family transcriptional regulator [Micropepsaceae bacterium]